MGVIEPGKHGVRAKCGDAKKNAPMMDIIPQPMAKAIQPERAACPGRPAPRFWPTRVIAAVPNALPHTKLLRAIETIGTFVAPAVRVQCAVAA